MESYGRTLAGAGGAMLTRIGGSCAPRKMMMNRSLPKVLVVDDDAAVRIFFREALKDSAARVAEVGDAALALESIESGDFDIIVCDVWMPGASGLDLLSMAQQTQWDVGFILVTGEIQVETVILALRMQASDFLLKPLTVEEITRSVAGAFERLVAARQARGPTRARWKPASNAAPTSWTWR